MLAEVVSNGGYWIEKSPGLWVVGSRQYSLATPLQRAEELRKRTC